MTIRLRAHHLLCVLTYVGRGYSPAFTANMTAITHRLAQRETVEMVAGPDDICAPLLTGAAAHCLGTSVAARDRQAARDIARMLGRTVAPGTRLRLGDAQLDGLRGAFASGAARPACAGCDWHGLCSEVARSGFRQALL